MPPAPMALLTKLLVVVASAFTGMSITMYMLRTMLAMASSRCPNLSTATKNMNQVAIDKKYCNIVKQEILSIRISN